MLQYLTSKKNSKKHDNESEPTADSDDIEEEEEEEEEQQPVLNDEDEAFLHRITSEGTPPPLPERSSPAPALPERPPQLPARPQDLPTAGETQGNNAQIALMNGAQEIPLPSAPDTPVEERDAAIGAEREGAVVDEDKGVKGKQKEGKRPSRWSFLRRDSRDKKRKAQSATAVDLMGVAESLKPPDAQPNEDGVVSDTEAKREEEEMIAIMDELNLAAVNNRVFSLSKESRDLLHKYIPPLLSLSLSL